MGERLEREIARLETRLDRGRAIDELATVRRGLASGQRDDRIELADVRVGFACKQRWEDMVGDDRVRACAGCERPVFNLSEMTRAEAEAVLATRGLTPCVRFYRRPDGTVMTTDCPTGVRAPPRRLAMVASSLAAAGSAFGAAPAMADPPVDNADPNDDSSANTGKDPIEIESQSSVTVPVQTQTYTVTMGAMVSIVEEKRPLVEWSVWGRLGVSVTPDRPDEVSARVSGPVMAEPTSRWEAAAAVDVTFPVASEGDVRLGVWGELRTSSGPVTGGELVVGGLPPHPHASRIDGAGNIVLRAGGNDQLISGGLGIGYVGSRPRYDPWIPQARHVTGGRVVVSVNRAIHDPRDWSATVGLELEPIGLLELVTRR